MPLQNRVDPWGAIRQFAARGRFMGNRGGAIHNERREIVRPFLNQRWITCVLEFKGRRRQVMSPGKYTELFFLDEAVSFAAGHRPCAECRRARFLEFREAWQRAMGCGPVLAPEMDAVLHRARIGKRREKVTFEASLDSLPDGCFVELDGEACLVWGGQLLVWSPEGYHEKKERRGGLAKVLTPAPVVECFRQGYRPEVWVATGRDRP